MQKHEFSKTISEISVNSNSEQTIKNRKGRAFNFSADALKFFTCAFADRMF